MGIPTNSGGRLRGAAWALTLIFAPLLAACAANAYAGIGLAPGAAEAELQVLARRAQAGDKQAQLDLGIRYEEGRGMPVNRARALRLYMLAAFDSGGAQLIYMPASGPRGQAATVPIYVGPPVPGLPAARARLAALLSGHRGGPR